MTKPTKYSIRAIAYYVCPICHWRTRSKLEIREHLKYEHQIRGNNVKLLKPRN